MENIQELVEVVGKHIKEKLNSPLIAPFIFSWFAWNYKFLIIFFGSGSFTKKLDKLDLLYIDLTDKAFHWFVYPMAASVIFVVIFPLISILCNGAIDSWIALRKVISGKVFKLQVNYAPQERVEALLKKIMELESDGEDWRTQLYDSKSKVRELERELNDLKSSNVEKDNQIKSMEGKLTELDTVRDELELSRKDLEQIRTSLESSKAKNQALSKENKQQKNDNDNLKSKLDAYSLNKVLENKLITPTYSNGNDTKLAGLVGSGNYSSNANNITNTAFGSLGNDTKLTGLVGLGNYSSNANNITNTAFGSLGNNLNENNLVGLGLDNYNNIFNNKDSNTIKHKLRSDIKKEN